VYRDLRKSSESREVLVMILGDDIMVRTQYIDEFRLLGTLNADCPQSARCVMEVAEVA
jgi:hypothetical protein